jgi:hypothetical protein
VVTPLRDAQVEVSVVGRGYGETVLVHLGWRDWLVVDSCTEDAAPAAPYAPLYLERIGVRFETVRWLLASHWQDDHVGGFSAMVRLCGRAEVFISEAMRSKEFVSLVHAEVAEPPGRISSGIREMRETLGELRARRRDVQQARADQRLFVDDAHGVLREIWALSPSNAASLRCKRAFVTEALPTATERRRIRAPESNETSVALFVRVGPVVVLLGADLEHEAADDRGWNAVLASRGRPRERASLFKLAHHGADNGDHPDVWTEMLDEQVVVALTPYGAAVRPRSDDADVARTCARTNDAYIAGPRQVRLARASSPVEKIRRRALRSAAVSERPLGHVQCRRNLDADAWTVALDGTAATLCHG